MSALENWKNHPASKRIGGTVVDADNGYFNILNGLVYDFETHVVHRADFRITPMSDNWVEIITYHAGTNKEIFYDEEPETIEEVIESLSAVAPAASILEKWENSRIAGDCGEVTEVDNALIIKDFPWADEESNDFGPVTLTIEAFRERPKSSKEWDSAPFFWVKAVSESRVFAEELEFENFEDMISMLESFKA